MSDAKGSNNDPSMDDILASIRKIISDDEARAQVSGGAAPQATAQSSPAGCVRGRSGALRGAAGQARRRAAAHRPGR